MNSVLHLILSQMEKDYSLEIYEKYFSSKNKIVTITLKNNTVLEGMLVSFIHGDPEEGDPYVTGWHFVDKKDMEAYQEGLDVSLEGNQDVGKIIEQKNIKEVKFEE